MRYSPVCSGARTVKVNVPVPPGATVSSWVVATRSAESQFTDMPSAANDLESPLMPRFACFPTTPRTHVAVPVFRKRTVTDVVVPGARVGHGVWSRKPELYVATGGGGGRTVPPAVLPAVVKSHSFVT